MSAEDRLDAEIATWLEAGPVVAPEGPILAALADVRGHRRHPGWRSASPGRRILVTGVGAAALVLAIGAGTVQLLSLGSRPPAGVGAAVAVAATERCVTTDPGTPVNAVETKGRLDACSVISADPRLTGDATRRLSEQRYTPSPGPYYLGHDAWGEFELRTRDGAWHGWMIGNGRQPDFTFDLLAVGEGAYEHLVLRATTTLAGDAWHLDGTIGPMGRDEVVGAVDLTAARVPSPSVAPDGVSYWSGLELTWTVRASDARITGSGSEVTDRRTRPDGTEAATGSVTLGGIGGTWSGSFATDSATIPFLRSGTLAGDGAYAGLALEYSLRTRDSYHHLLDGVIVTAP